MHESQSKLWENHVARNPAFAEVLVAELGARRLRGDAAASCTPRSSASSRPLIRVSADPLTYPLHIILRFELELAMIEGELAVADLPGAWRDGMRRLLGVEVHLRRARLPAGRALGGRQLRLLPQLRAGLPDRRAAVGGDRGASSGRARRNCAAAKWRRSSGGWPSTCIATAAGSTRCELVEQATGAPLERRAVPALRRAARRALTGLSRWSSPRFRPLPFSGRVSLRPIARACAAVGQRGMRAALTPQASCPVPDRLRKPGCSRKGRRLAPVRPHAGHRQLGLCVGDVPRHLTKSYSDVPHEREKRQPT